ncbi:MAG: DNA methylase [Verrucomicrobia bacterium]|jgi:hypothetical protein|nr:DNA methylase [Verrucomicrobiota bacterium]
MSEFDQSNLDLSTETASGPVECLGQTFESDDARREHYTELLREKLKDPEFRKIEGFPIGEDEDILALSDPPYYTACPNPWIEDFVKHHGRPYDPKEKYHREPFAADVSEGKNHPIYTAHSYHTKVPHRAIMRYILHYTEPGDLVFDGFCGTGMTGVAAQLCGDKSEVQELGYRVDQSGEIYDEEGKAFSKLGKRKAVLNDLSPAASFIACNYNTPINVGGFERETQDLLNEVEKECEWMYQTTHTDGTMARVNYIVWSDIFNCGSCSGQINFWEVAFDAENNKVKPKFKCPYCSYDLDKKSLTPIFDTYYDTRLSETKKIVKQTPVLINYNVGRKKYDKKPDAKDFDLIRKVSELQITDWVPSSRMMEGQETRRNDSKGLTHVHHYYTKRNLIILSKLKQNLSSIQQRLLFNSQLINLSKLNRYRPGVSFPYNPLSGTMYVSSQVSEADPFKAYRNKLKNLVKALCVPKSRNAISTQSLFKLPSNSLDYVFVDPPFGANLNYSELSSLWEYWLKVRTNNKLEAIQHRKMGKTLGFYRDVMYDCFCSLFYALKPGRWMTVEFSNTSSAVWNSIQSALQEAGFIVANVSALDKQLGSFKAVTTSTAVKQDLVISAYKPPEQLEIIFSERDASIAGVWEFMDSHLKRLPVSKPKGGSLEFVAERDPRILYDRMVAFYIGHNAPVPLSSGEFQVALEDKYPARDGMAFLPEQVAEYDRLAAKMKSVGQMVVFVEDEKSAIGWLRQILKDKPSTYSTINPDFMQQLSESWRKFETLPELSVLLDQNFLKYSGDGDVPSQIHGYLSTDYHDLRNLEKDDPRLQAKAKDRWYVPDPKKMADVEAQREKKLLAEFWSYAAQAGVERGQTQTSQANLPLGESTKKKSKVKKLKEVRTDAVRAGFMECQRNNQGAVILAVAEILPANVIEENEQLQMIYDMAEMRAG